MQHIYSRPFPSLKDAKSKLKYKYTIHKYVLPTNKKINNNSNLSVAFYQFLILMCEVHKTIRQIRFILMIVYTSEAHSCKVPTTGMSMLECCDLSSRANSGMAPARRIANLLRSLLLQLQRASAPHRATSTSCSCAGVMMLPIGAQSSNATCLQVRLAEFIPDA